MILTDLLHGLPVLSGLEEGTIDIRGLAYASDDVRPGFLFAALKGARRDGLDFAPEAVANGAAAILSDRPRPDGWTIPWIRVFDPREALALAAANFYDRPAFKMKLVGVTGTKGKTTITYILESILRKAGFAVGVIGTISHRGPGFVHQAGRTTPESVDLQRILKDMVDQGVTHGVMEVSSHSLDLKRVAGMSFDVSVFTNLTGEHLDYHPTMEDYFEAKKKLFTLNSKKRTAVVNQDDPWGERLIAGLPMTTITFGFQPVALVRAERFRFEATGIEALVKYPGGQTTVVSPLVGRHNLSNILASFAVALALNIPVPAIREGISGLRQVPGRFEKVENDLGLNVFVDYAHTDAAMRSLLEAVRDLRPPRIILVFGAGGDRDQSKRSRMGEEAARFADWSFLTSDNPRGEDPLAILAQIEEGLKSAGSGKYSLVPDRREAISQALAFARKGDFVLLVGKGHETTQTIGDRVLPFNDAEVAREILQGMKADG